jgi:lipopolysaccharide export LptBFGC system permease protein LptF
MDKNQLKLLSFLCLMLGFSSIIASIAIWYLTGGKTIESQAHGERFGIFVGLWAPTFMILSNRFDRYAEQRVTE